MYKKVTILTMMKLCAGKHSHINYVNMSALKKTLTIVFVESTDMTWIPHRCQKYW